MKLFIGLFLSLFFLNSNAAEVADFQNLDVKVKKQFIRHEFQTQIYYDVASTLSSSPLLKSIPGFNPYNVANSFCLAQGYDRVSARKLADIGMDHSDSFNSLIGKEVIRYSKGKLQRVTIPAKANDLLGLDISPATKFRLPELAKENMSWNDIQQTLILPYISSITCEKEIPLN